MEPGSYSQSINLDTLEEEEFTIIVPEIVIKYIRKSVVYEGIM